MIISHNNRIYRYKRSKLGAGRFNGAFYYSQEIVNNIIPNVKTDRNWVTVDIGVGLDHSIVFVHNNINPRKYDWLKRYKDIVLVCGVEETVDKVKDIGKAIYLPLSIDVKEVQKYKRKKNERSGEAFAGRPSKRTLDGVVLPNCHYIENMDRSVFLHTMARFEYIYAVGRTAIEAKALGCKLKAYDPRYPDPTIWKVLDNKDAAKILQKELNIIDGI